MGTHLAKALSLYFEKHSTANGGRQFTFRNGMSLSTLAWAMGQVIFDRTQKASFGPPKLWKVVKGQLHFTAEQLEIFCEILNLPYAEQWELEQALRRDLSTSQHLDPGLLISPNDIKHSLEIINQTDVMGAPQQAVAEADWLSARLQHLADHASPRARAYYLISRAETLRLKGWALDGIATPDGLAAKTSLMAELRSIARTCAHAQSQGVADALAANAEHIERRPRSAIYYAKRALRNLTNPRDILFQYRVLALDYAALALPRYLANYEEAWREASALIDALPSTDRDGACIVLEGFARAQAQLGLFDEARKTLERGRAIYARLEACGVHLPSPSVQLVRAELEILKHSGTRDRYYVEPSITVAILRARDHGYRRLAGQVEALAGELYN